MVEPTAISNIHWTDSLEKIFQFKIANEVNQTTDTKVVFMRDLLSKKQNTELLEKVSQKPAMYSNIYSPSDELKIFTELFEQAISTHQKVHIIWITLKEEVLMLEAYYSKLGFMRDDINCFEVDFSKVLVSASVHIENLIWKGSDYKAQWKKIFFIPPVRESWQNKAMFTWINRWSIAGLYTQEFWDVQKDFLTECVTSEKILPLMLSKVLFYNLHDIGIAQGNNTIEIQY